MRRSFCAIALIILCAAAVRGDEARAQQLPAGGPIPPPLARPCPGGTAGEELHVYSECNARDGRWHVVTDQSYMCPNPAPPPADISQRVRISDIATDQRCDDQPIDPNAPPRTMPATRQTFPQIESGVRATRIGRFTVRTCEGGVWLIVVYDVYRAETGQILVDWQRGVPTRTNQPCNQTASTQQRVAPAGSTPVFTLEPTGTARDQRTAAAVGQLINIVAYADAINAVNVSSGMVSLDQKIGVAESPQHARNDGSEVIEIAGAVDAAPIPLARRVNSAIGRLVGLLRRPAYQADAGLMARAASPAWSTGALRSDSSQTAASQPPIQLLFKSLGGSAGEILEMQVFKNGPGPVRLEGLDVVLEPLKENAARQITNELRKRAAKAVETIRLNAYCLEFLKAPPSPGTMFRIAPQAIQQQFAPMRKIMSAARRVHNAGQLKPDSDPASYFHSIRQWAIWTTEQRLDQDGFRRRFLEHTRKNVVGAGRPWSKDLEGLVEKTVPNRWNDIGKVLDAARSAAGGGPDAR